MTRTIFRAFGKFFTRDEAEQLMYKDKLCEIVYARNYDTLEHLILYGWEGVTRLSDNDLQEKIDELVEENVNV